MKKENRGSNPLAGITVAAILLASTAGYVSALSRMFDSPMPIMEAQSDFHFDVAPEMRTATTQSVDFSQSLSRTAPAWFTNAMPAYSSGSARQLWYLSLNSSSDTQSSSQFYGGTSEQTRGGYLLFDRAAFTTLSPTNYFAAAGGATSGALTAPSAPTVNGTVYTWSTSTTSTAWLNATNWTGNSGHYPGVDANPSSTADGAANDIATFTTIAVAGAAPTIGINFNTSSSTGVTTNTGANGSLALGTIDFNGSKSITLNNSSTTLDGTLTLNGGNTINGINDTIIANEGATNLTFSNGSSKKMDIALGDATTNTIQVNGAGNITINSTVKDGAGSAITLTSTGTPTGALILTAANTYTGGTTINAGTLLANNTTGSATGTGAVTVNNTGTLGGTGTINAGANNITVSSGGTITGATNGTVGTLTLAANTLVIGGTNLVDINGLTADRITLTGNLDLGTEGDTLNFNQINAPTAASYTLVSYTGTLTGTFDNVLNLPSGYELQYNTGEIDLVAVPEMSTWISAALALGAIGFMQRRRIRGLMASRA